ncbi:MAG: hypothetical protein OXP71_02200 [Candidatus Poribacteria bacterium]|nr:hypothetical protein [Candidatus Poribacteria bacterium]
MEKQNFEHVECNKLTVTNNDGAVIEMSFAPDGRPFISVSRDGKGSVLIHVDKYGGGVCVFANDGTARIELLVASDDHGYVLSGSREERRPYIPPVGTPVAGSFVHENPKD